MHRMRRRDVDHVDLRIVGQRCVTIMDARRAELAGKRLGLVCAARAHRYQFGIRYSGQSLGK